VLQLPKGGAAVTIAPAILEHFPDLNEPQRRVIAHLDGPLLVIAGPGSGKTYSVRALPERVRNVDPSPIRLEDLARVRGTEQ
jgi:hypothetical protein